MCIAKCVAKPMGKVAAAAAGTGGKAAAAAAGGDGGAAEAEVGGAEMTTEGKEETSDTTATVGDKAGMTEASTTKEGEGKKSGEMVFDLFGVKYQTSSS